MLVYLGYLLLLATIIKYKPQQHILQSVFTATLFFSVLIVALTELLSYFKCLNLTFVAGSWSVFCLVLIFLLLKNKAETIATLNFNRKKIIAFYKSLIFKEKVFLSFVAVSILLLFIQGLLYPPNNWDSLTYHMSRIMYWLGNESVAHYPTNILRDLYQPPFTEYFILHINLLNGNDYLSNSVQLFFLTQILVLFYSLLTVFNTPRLLKITALLLIITIPSLELQATNTKNDIVCAFFIMSALYFSIKSVKLDSFSNYLFLGISIGLALLTKGTAYLFLPPILLCFGIAIIYKVWTKKELKPLGFCFIIPLLILTLNASHYLRNYSVNHSLLSVDDIESKGLSNDEMNSKFLFSNLLKNAGLHLGFPINRPSDYLIRTIHTKMNISIDDKRLNYYGSPYEGAREGTTHEDYVPNTIAFILSILSFIVIINGFRTNKNKKSLLLVFIIGTQIILFAGYLKWQPWHTRLHIPIFILSVIAIVYAVQISNWYKKVVLGIIPFLMLSFLFYFLFNNTRPIIKAGLTKDVRLTDSRFKKYFSNQPQLYSEYSDVLTNLYNVNPKKIGLNLNDWEYPLLNSYYYDHLKIVAINVSNGTNKIPQDTTNIDAIISNYNNPTIDYNGVTYINQDNNHSYIWFYKKANQ
jgi:4-amino-4-deoxy-L-arabinose transferase-like glycosyltransferase